MRAEMYEIVPCPLGRLATMPCPRGGDWLLGEICSLRTAGVTDLVSLLTPPEEVELGLLSELKYCEQMKIRLHRHPVPDRDVPVRAEFDPFVASLLPVLKRNGFLAIHCRVGIGRSSVLAAGLLCRLGVPAQEAITRISRARGFEIPDTQQQLDFILNLDQKNCP